MRYKGREEPVRAGATSIAHTTLFRERPLAAQRRGGARKSPQQACSVRVSVSSILLRLYGCAKAGWG